MHNHRVTATTAARALIQNPITPTVIDPVTGHSRPLTKGERTEGQRRLRRGAHSFFHQATVGTIHRAATHA